MDSFEWNKIAMAVLLSLVVMKTADLLSEALVHPHMLAKNAYVIEGVEAVADGGGAAKEEPLQPIEPLLASATAENGKTIAKQCLQCHDFEKGGPNKIGPNLHDTFGNDMAHHEGFAYSSALKDKKEKWTPENLNHFLAKPRNFIPGTKMSFAGLKKAEDRAAVIVYLKSLKGS